jgi:multidrug efflux pump subunit AcrA (membrane-fusion protein)
VRKAKVIAAVTGVLVIAGAVAAFAISNAGVSSVQTAEVTKGNLSVSVTASGDVKATSRVDVYPPTAGTLASVEVTEGAVVHAGQVLAVMDTAPIEVQVAQADAAYAAAVAQRNAATATMPGATERQAAQAAVDAAYAAFQIADKRYQQVKAGIGIPTAADIAAVQAEVDAAQQNYDSANQAFMDFDQNVYQPAPEPRSVELETTRAGLLLARSQAASNLASARQALASVQAAADVETVTAAAKIQRDQAYAAYLGAVSQRDALTKASASTGAKSAADSAVAAAAAAKSLANETLSKATIVAPADGIVLFNGGGASLGSSSLAALTGGGGSSSAGSSTLAAGSAVSPASAPFSIVTLDALTFTALVDETEIIKVQPGMKTVVTLDGLPNEPLDGTVTKVGIESVTTPTGGTAFPVEIAFVPGKSPVLIGMNGSVNISIETIENVIAIPVEALLEEGGASYVWVVEGNHAQRKKVEPGRFTETRVEIRSGLAEGDKVIVSDTAGLKDGARVQAK